MLPGIFIRNLSRILKLVSALLVQVEQNGQSGDGCAHDHNGSVDAVAGLGVGGVSGVAGTGGRLSGAGDLDIDEVGIRSDFQGRDCVNGITIYIVFPCLLRVHGQAADVEVLADSLGNFRLGDGLANLLTGQLNDAQVVHGAGVVNVDINQVLIGVSVNMNSCAFAYLFLHGNRIALVVLVIDMTGPGITVVPIIFQFVVQFLCMSGNEIIDQSIFGDILVSLQMNGLGQGVSGVQVDKNVQIRIAGDLHGIVGAVAGVVDSLVATGSLALIAVLAIVAQCLIAVVIRAGYTSMLADVAFVQLAALGIAECMLAVVIVVCIGTVIRAGTLGNAVGTVSSTLCDIAASFVQSVASRFLMAVFAALRAAGTGVSNSATTIVTEQSGAGSCMTGRLTAVRAASTGGLLAILTDTTTGATTVGISVVIRIHRINFCLTDRTLLWCAASCGSTAGVTLSTFNLLPANSTNLSSGTGCSSARSVAKSRNLITINYMAFFFTCICCISTLVG